MPTHFWICLALGLIPYMIQRTQEPFQGRTLEIRALFWQLELQHDAGRCRNWIVRVPLIIHLRNAVWAAVMRLGVSDSRVTPGDASE